MQGLKRIITSAVCLTIAALSFSGCSQIFGNRCKHGSYTRGQDESVHYKICSECNEKFDVANHDIALSYSAKDKTQHFKACKLCGYRTDYEPHVFGSWTHGNVSSSRKCTVTGCGYIEECSHSCPAEYVISGDSHYTECGNCGKKLSFETAHIFNVYSDVTDDAHTVTCKCGKIKAESVPHEFNYRHDADNDTHWQACECGFEGEKEACTYGEYLPGQNAHYRVCSVCESKSAFESHSFKLNADRQKLCTKCSYKLHPYALLLGTWQYNDGRIMKLTIKGDWSYTIVNYGGEVVESGDFDVSYFEGIKGDITGTISLFPGKGFQNTYIEFKFRKDERDKFTDKNNRAYYRK